MSSLKKSASAGTNVASDHIFQNLADATSAKVFSTVAKIVDVKLDPVSTADKKNMTHNVIDLHHVGTAMNPIKPHQKTVSITS